MLRDRSAVDRTIGEMRLSSSGFFSEDTRAKFGKSIGATHLLFVNYMRFPEKDVETRRLIDVETGRVLANVVGEKNR